MFHRLYRRGRSLFWMAQCSLAVLASSMLLVPVSHAGGAPDALPPGIKVEVGTLNGVAYRIDMPTSWNGTLVMYYHGYRETPVTYDAKKSSGIGTGLATAGFAVAQSAYSVTGWALEQAIPETEALRQYTIAHYGVPKETYVTGHSMGGQLTIATIENYPNRYDGALPLCGLLEPTSYAIARGGALIAAFHYYYPDLLPGPAEIPAAAVLDDALAKKVQAALPSNPVGRAELLALGHFKKDEDLADVITFFTYIQRDLAQKAGRSTLDNANAIYVGGTDDDALNLHVKRYTATPEALAYLRTWYTPTGVLSKPTLAVHTTYDPIIAADSIALYADAVQRAGSTANFVQQLVAHDGHCAISGAETMMALEELISWKRTGVRPAAGPLTVR